MGDRFPDLEITRRDALKAGVVGAGVVGLGVYGSSSALAQSVPDSISGTVLDAQGGSPVQGATVIAVPHSADGTHRSDLNPLEATTDVNGDYEFDADALHAEEVYYHVICRNGDQNDPERGQENYPWVLAEGVATLPDPGDLHARYDATELALSDDDQVSQWGDETGNGHHLTQATGSKQPVYKTGVIGGNPVVRFDGMDDLLDVAFSTLSQANHIFLVFQLQSGANGARGYFSSEDESTDINLFFNGSGDTWNINAGATVSGSTIDTNQHIGSLLFNGASSGIRIDGVQDASGNAGSEGLDGFTVGARGDESIPADVDVGEILIYPQNKSSVVDDVESYLSDKWGITI